MRPSCSSAQFLTGLLMCLIKAARNSMIWRLLTAPSKKRKQKRHQLNPAIADICFQVKLCWMTG
jgi:hypothetical protein